MRSRCSAPRTRTCARTRSRSPVRSREEEIDGDYERATGDVLVQAVAEHGPAELPCALVRGHAPFCWGSDAADAVEIAVTLEEVARTALLTTVLDPDVPPLEQALRDKHHRRKHGPRAYYGQR